MKLKDYLYLNRMTVKDFAKKIGYSRVMISSVKQEKRTKAGFRLKKAIVEATEGEVSYKDLDYEL